MSIPSPTGLVDHDLHPGADMVRATAPFKTAAPSRGTSSPKVVIKATS